MDTAPNTSTTRDALLDAATRLFADRGYGGTKVSDIVRLARFGQGTVYWHFRNKADVALALIEKLRDGFLVAIAKGYRLEPAPREDMVRSSTLLFTELFAFAEANRETVLFVLVRSHGAVPEIGEAVADARRAIYTALRRNIERAIDLGMLDGGIDPALQAALLQSLIEGTITWWLFGPAYSLEHRPTPSLDEVVAGLVRLEFHGLRGRPDAGDRSAPAREA